MVLIPVLLSQFVGPAPRIVTQPRLPILANDEAWKRLPGAPETPQPLPAWARILAGPMPMTVARMIELDALHRSGDGRAARAWSSYPHPQPLSPTVRGEKEPRCARPLCNPLVSSGTATQTHFRAPKGRQISPKSAATGTDWR